MPRRKTTVPAYLHHRPSNRAYVRLPDGVGGRKTVYLGLYNSDESRQKYARLLAEVAGSPVPATASIPPEKRGNDVTVNEVILAFWRHAERHYRRADGTPTDELGQYRQTFRLVKELYGRTPAAEFGPRTLKALRQKMIDVGWTRKLINQRIGRVRRAIKWAASEELIPAAVYQGLATVTGLQAGRTQAKEMPPVGPVADAAVRATLPFLNRHVRGMVEFQRLTGCRPGEACRVRPCDVDTSALVWVFRPPQHKNQWRGKPRAIPVGPKAQQLLSAFTPADPAVYYFSPRRAVAEHHAARTAARKTPRYPSHMRLNAKRRVREPGSNRAERYSLDSYDQAVERAVEKANARRQAMAGPGNFDPVPHWHPNQLRHSFATEVRRRYGLEAAQVSLGHEKADVTQVYAERNLTLAAKVAAEIG